VGLALKKITKYYKSGHSLATKFLEFLNQNGRSRWTQLENLVDHDNRKNRSARTGKTLKWLRNKGWVDKEGDYGKSTYFITNAGLDALRRRKTVSQLAASAPYYFKSGEFISFGQELEPEDQKEVIHIFMKYPALRNITNLERERTRFRARII